MKEARDIPLETPFPSPGKIKEKRKELCQRCCEAALPLIPASGLRPWPGTLDRSRGRVLKEVLTHVEDGDLPYPVRPVHLLPVLEKPSFPHV